MKDGAFLRAFQALLQTPTLPDLGPGPRPGVQALPRLKTELEELFDRDEVPSPQRHAFRSAAFLWHDYLDESHQISQDLPDANGSYLHALMHRREPDYSNAKYWFRRVALHPVFIEVARRARERLDRDPSSAAVAAKALPEGKWDPFGFVDLCESVATGQQNLEECRVLIDLQAIEFEELVIHLSRSADLLPD